MRICLGLRMYPSTPHGRFTAKPEVVGLVGGCWDWGCVLAVDATMMLPLICASLGGSGVVIRSPQVVRGGGSGTHYRPPTVLFPRNWA